MYTTGFKYEHIVPDNGHSINIGEQSRGLAVIVTCDIFISDETTLKDGKK